VAKTGETMYDQRLFNQEGGMASGLATDDTYNLYDKTLWADRGNNLYKPRNPEEDGGEADGTVRQFRPDKVHPPPPPPPPGPSPLRRACMSPLVVGCPAAACGSDLACLVRREGGGVRSIGNLIRLFKSRSISSRAHILYHLQSCCGTFAP